MTWKLSIVVVWIGLELGLSIRRAWSPEATTRDAEYNRQLGVLGMLTFPILAWLVLTA